MSKIVLGIETSCDETAAAIVERRADGSGHILSNIVLSQDEAHAAFGGVVPEIAARAHIETLGHIIQHALDKAHIRIADLHAVAATAGPGLIGGVIVGLVTAKAIASATNKPLIAVNHLEGHALTARLTHSIDFPYLLLLVSGGHTQIVAVQGLGQYKRLGSTLDDALGEAFDKTAKLLGLGYPGGPAVEKMAINGNPTRFAFPRPLLGREGCDFSLSGLKTAVRQQTEAIAPVTDADIADICASFQTAVADIVQDRLRRAFRAFHSLYLQDAPSLVVAGGVAANKALHHALQTFCQEERIQLIIPPASLCTDNGAMIAWVGAERLAAGLVDTLSVPARARWPLDTASEPVLGSGKTGIKV